MQHGHLEAGVVRLTRGSRWRATRADARQQQMMAPMLPQPGPNKLLPEGAHRRFIQTSGRSPPDADRAPSGGPGRLAAARLSVSNG
ncbi:hypothetical protein M8494_19880 [Serratia ureilytica]